MRQRHCFLRRRGVPPPYAYLFYLLVVGSLFTSVTASRYLTFDSCGDGASAAVVALSASGSSGSLIHLEPGGQDSYSFTVSNHEADTVSQVALQYDVVVAGNLPAGITVQLDGKTGTNAGGEYIFSDAGIFPAGQEDNKTHTLTLTADADSDVAPSVEITVIIHAEQVD